MFIILEKIVYLLLGVFFVITSLAYFLGFSHAEELPRDRNDAKPLSPTPLDAKELLRPSVPPCIDLRRVG